MDIRIFQQRASVSSGEMTCALVSIVMKLECEKEWMYVVEGGILKVASL